MKLYDKGYTIKQRLTGVLVVALIPPLFLVLAFACLASLATMVATSIMDWYERLLKSMKKKGG